MATASFRIFEGYSLDFGVAGLAPGATINTFWRGWSPQPVSGRFTVTVSAHPATNVAGNETVHAANALAVAQTSVQYVPTIKGDLVLVDVIVNARLLNAGPAAIRWCSLNITFHELH